MRAPARLVIAGPPLRRLLSGPDNGGMDMDKSIVNESPRRRITRRVGAAGMAVATVLVLGACQATGGGFIGDPLTGSLSASTKVMPSLGSPSTARWIPRRRGPGP